MEMVEVKQPIPLWETQGEEKRNAVQGIFSRIAGHYDFVNRVISLNRDRAWRKIATKKLELQSGDHVLDLCCGTGDFFPPLRSSIGSMGSITGLDFCAPMLKQASKKDESSQLLLGDACNLPLCDQQFDGVTVGWGIRNVPDIDLAHREAFRVLKSGKRFVSLDCAEPENALVRFTTRLGRSFLTKLLGLGFRSVQEYSYLDESSKRFKTREELRASMEAAGFIDVQFQDLMFGNICIHWGTKP